SLPAITGVPAGHDHHGGHGPDDTRVPLAVVDVRPARGVRGAGRADHDPGDRAVPPGTAAGAGGLLRPGPPDGAAPTGPPAVGAGRAPGHAAVGVRPWRRVLDGGGRA